MEERIYWLAWSQINGVGAVLLQRIEQHFGSLAEAWNAPARTFAEIEGFGNKLIETVANERSRFHPEEFFRNHIQKNPHFWTPADPEYPHLLRETPSPPPVLYYRGQVQLEENQGITPAIAIVGTREPTEYGKRWTRKLSEALAKHGFTVVSGMAAGIDTQAHHGCLAARGRTIAVLGTGVDIAYPSSNQQLYQQIVSQGLILSEYPSGTQPQRGNFPARNRIIAGLCRAVLIMEAPTKSGALITARFANDFGRDVYVLPGSLDNQQAIGCLGLLNRGAHVILNEGHLLEMLGMMPHLDVFLPANIETHFNLNNSLSPSQGVEIKKKEVRELDLEPELAQILQVISTEPTSFDSIVQKTNLDTGSILALLSQLELMGLVSQLPGMRYQLS
jgi:DNA processing protein